ncbi:MAG: hypothetical protein AAF357_08060 [Verrucomicrobiota bacterium]
MFGEKPIRSSSVYPSNISHEIAGSFVWSGRTGNEKAWSDWMAEVCFVICPIGPDKSDVRKRSDQWVRHVVRPVAEEKGYEVLRADEMPDSGVITNQVINAILESPLVIADLSGGNPNVFYELALRHATGKAYIQMIEAGEKIPFDVQVIRTITYDLRDPDNLNTAGATLRRHVESIQKGQRVDSPVSMALTESFFTENDNAVQVFLEKFWQIEADFESLNTAIDRLQDKMGDLSDDVSSIESEVSSLATNPQGQSADSNIASDVWRIQRDISQIQNDIAAIKGTARQPSN